MRERAMGGIGLMFNGIASLFYHMTTQQAQLKLLQVLKPMADDLSMTRGVGAVTKYASA